MNLSMRMWSDRDDDILAEVRHLTCRRSVRRYRPPRPPLKQVYIGLAFPRFLFGRADSLA